MASYRLVVASDDGDFTYDLDSRNQAAALGEAEWCMGSLPMGLRWSPSRVVRVDDNHVVKEYAEGLNER